MVTEGMTNSNNVRLDPPMVMTKQGPNFGTLGSTSSTDCLLFRAIRCPFVCLIFIGLLQRNRCELTIRTMNIFALPLRPLSDQVGSFLYIAAL